MRRAPTTVEKVPSGPDWWAFLRRSHICRLERVGAACSIPCIRNSVRDLRGSTLFDSSKGWAGLYLFANESAKLPSSMNKLQKWWRPALAIVGIVIALQVSVSLLVRTNRGHAYLIAHLERAFGRQAEVESFDARSLPRPQLDANGVTVGEDPSFGYEYFLRAENLSTNLRVLGLLRGHFEFGTMALNKPSLILVRNSEGRWNLERWLPPAKTIPVQDLAVFGPASPVAPVN